jgi:catalase
MNKLDQSLNVIRRRARQHAMTQIEDKRTGTERRNNVAGRGGHHIPALDQKQRIRRDLWNAIKSGAFPEWELGLQLFDDDFADRFQFDVLDATKIIPEEQVPVRRVGRLVLDRCVDNFFAETEQVAFHTGNIVPGVDFTDDPLLQGRNFSYLDTQLKRLGSPNFTHLPINAPKCPFHTLQQDGHMAMINPTGRVNYEPNSWEEGPRERPERGIVSFPAQIAALKQRVRGEKFADHYSQARQFYVSQTEPEQTHIKDAFIFELSKCDNPAVRVRMVSHLINVDEMLAKRVAHGLGLKAMPAPAEPALPVIKDLPASPALSIARNGPGNFEGRKIGVLAADGADAKLLAALEKAAVDEEIMVEFVAPQVGGFVDSEGDLHPAQQRINGGPSVLYDAVAILLSADGAELLANDAAAKDFVSDAFAHAKFIAHSESARPLLDKAGITPDDGVIPLKLVKDARHFITQCRQLRLWKREAQVHMA